MSERKDMGELPKAEVLPPQPTGRRAVVLLQVGILVEVQENDSWSDMVSQAQDEVRKRVKEATGFLPFRTETETIYDSTTVAYMQQRLTISPKKGL